MDTGRDLDVYEDVADDEPLPRKRKFKYVYAALEESSYDPSPEQPSEAYVTVYVCYVGSYAVMNSSFVSAFRLFVFLCLLCVIVFDVHYYIPLIFFSQTDTYILRPLKCYFIFISLCICYFYHFAFHICIIVPIVLYWSIS